MYKQKPVDQSVYNALWAEQNKFWIFGFDEKAKRRSEGLAPYLLMDSFNLWDSKKVLDAGCGYGYLCKFLQEYGADVTGLDYSDYFVSNKVHNNVIKGDMTELLFKDNSFDLVISRENFEHLTVEQADKAFSEMVRVTNKWIYMTIWMNFDKNASDEDILDDTDNDPTHITYATRGFWNNKFKKYIDSSIIKEREDIEEKLDWKGFKKLGKSRVFVFEKLQ